MAKIKGVLRSEKAINKAIFAAVIAALVLVVGVSMAFGNLLTVTNTVDSGYNYGYFSDTNGYKDYGYNTYLYNPIKDTIGQLPNGSLVKTAAAADVYLIDEGMKRHVTSPVAFESWGYRWSDIQTVSAAQLAAYETFGTHVQMRPGTLVKALHDLRVYIFGFDSALHWIESPVVFNNLGLKWSDVREILPSELNAYTVSAVTYVDSDVLADGTLVKGSGAEVYLWELQSGGTHQTLAHYDVEWIRSPVAFESWGFGWNSIATISDVELAYYVANQPGDDIKAKPGTLLKGTALNVYVVDNLAVQTRTVGPPASTYQWVKRWISSPTVFTNKGYNWSNVKSESDAEIATYSTGAVVQ